MISRLPMMLLAVILVCCGCQPSPGDFEDAQDGRGKSSLTETPEWILQTMARDGQACPLVPRSRVTISFAARDFRGNTGCNHFSGRYTVKRDGRFGLQELMVTEMACPGKLMEQESSFLEILMRTDRVSVTDDVLVMQDESTKNVLEFSPFTPVSLPLQGTTWQLTHFTESSGRTSSAMNVLTKTPITMKISDDRVNGSSGAHSFQGKAALLEQGRLRFEEIEIVEDAKSVELGEQEARYLQDLAHMTGFVIRENVLTLFNTDQTRGLQFRAESPETNSPDDEPL